MGLNDQAGQLLKQGNQAAGEGIYNLLKNLIGTVTNGNSLDPVSVGAGMVGNEPVKSPFQEGAAKALKKIGEASVMHAHASGVSPQAMEQKLQQTYGPDLSGNGSGSAGGGGGTSQPDQPQAQPQAPAVNPPGLGFQNPYTGSYSDNTKPNNGISNFLQTLLTIGTGGIVQTPGYSRGMAINTANQQRAVGSAGVQTKIAEANQVPPSQMENKQLQAGAYSAEVGALKDQMDAIDKTRQTMAQQLNSIMQHPVLNSVTGGPKVSQLRSQINALNTSFNQIQSQLASKVKSHPNSKTQESNGPFKIGDTYKGEVITNVKRIG